MLLLIEYEVGANSHAKVSCSFAKIITEGKFEKCYGRTHNEGENGYKNRKV